MSLMLTQQKRTNLQCGSVKSLQKSEQKQGKETLYSLKCANLCFKKFTKIREKFYIFL